MVRGEFFHQHLISFEKKKHLPSCCWEMFFSFSIIIIESSLLADILFFDRRFLNISLHAFAWVLNVNLTSIFYLNLKFWFLTHDEWPLCQRHLTSGSLLKLCKYYYNHLHCSLNYGDSLLMNHILLLPFQKSIRPFNHFSLIKIM